MSDFRVKAVNTAIAWEYHGLPASNVRCALCLVDCASPMEGPSQRVGEVRVHGACGAVVHEHCRLKYAETASGNICPQCRGPATFTALIDLFATK